MSARHVSKPTRAHRALIVALLTPLVALALSATAQALVEAPNRPFKKTLIGGVTEIQKKVFVAVLDSPCGVAVRPTNGATLVSDYYRRSIIGSFLPNFFPGNGPCGLATDVEGNLYVNYWHGAIVNPATGVIDSGPATGVAVDSVSGDLYVNRRDSIAIYESPVDPQQAPLEIGEGTLKDGYGVAVSLFPDTKGLIYAADAADNTVKVYDPAAADPDQPVQIIDGAGTSAGHFVSLVDSSLAIDGTNGHLLVADNTQPGFEHPQAVIHEFNAEGLYRGRLGPVVAGEPVGIAVNESPIGRGDVYVTSGNGTSLVFPPADGPPPSELGSLSAFGPSGQGRILTATTSGAGEGTVKSSPAGINCPGACEAELNEGGTIVLTATPKAGSAFGAWSGACTGTGSCQVPLDAAAAVDAEFVPAPALKGAQHGGAGAVSAGADAGAPASSAGALRLGRPSLAGATVTLEATVPGSGTLTATGKGLKRVRASSARAGTLTLRLRLSPAGHRALARSKSARLALRVAVAFKPSGGAPGSVVGRTVTFAQTK